MTYEVESNGGYLSVGKLTGKLEKRGERREERGEGTANHQSSIINHHLSNPQSLIPNPFVIHTPTATVTDLGTEFGVTVDTNGTTETHVFQGKVTLQVLDGGRSGGVPTVLLGANESARVDGGSLLLHRGVAAFRAFVRRMPSQRTIKHLDLVDIVAGGNGSGTARNRGIHPNTGEIVDHTPSPELLDWGLGTSDGRYHRVNGLPLVDGVFVPDDRRGPVQLDSAGHTFDGFHTSDDRVFNYIWAGGELPAPGGAGSPTRTTLDDVDYGENDNSSVLGSFGVPHHSVLGMVANKGITFDLAAIRRAHPGGEIVRFRAVAGNTERREDIPGREKLKFDLRVFVDGQPRFSKVAVNTEKSLRAIPITVPLGKDDRFLTLVVSDGGDHIDGDHVIFGDPHLDVEVSTVVQPATQEATSK